MLYEPRHTCLLLHLLPPLLFAHLGLSWATLGPSSLRLGLILAPSWPLAGRLLAPSRIASPPFWLHLGLIIPLFSLPGHGNREKRVPFTASGGTLAFRSPGLGSRCSWVHVGHLGAILGPLWLHVGAILALTWLILGHFGPNSKPLRALSWAPLGSTAGPCGNLANHLRARLAPLRVWRLGWKRHLASMPQASAGGREALAIRGIIATVVGLTDAPPYCKVPRGTEKHPRI